MFYTENYDELLEKVDAVYIVSKPEKHYIDTVKHKADMFAAELHKL